MTTEEIVSGAKKYLDAKGLTNESFYVGELAKSIIGLIKKTGVSRTIYDFLHIFPEDPLLFEARIKDFVKKIQEQPTNGFILDPVKHLRDFVKENGI